jgi:GTP diphosphokinase / guanosine-3',5'-bis(diphosphate) 3'-diphosphatase
MKAHEMSLTSGLIDKTSITSGGRAGTQGHHMSLSWRILFQVGRHMTGWTQEVYMQGHGIGTILKAAQFAADRHRNQRRKDAEASPYINHPIALANVLANEGGITDPVVLCAALLHDTIEDTDTTADELHGRFGDEITGVVLEVTDDKSLPKAERKRLQVEHARTASPRAKLVKLADKICNLRDIAATPPADWTQQRKTEYFDWARQVIDGVRGTHPQLEAIFDAAYRARDSV